jgi:DNA (cytosine-5)-methyltransferase 1
LLDVISEGKNVVSPQANNTKTICKTKQDSSMNKYESSIIEEAHRSFLLRNITLINDIFNALYGSPNHGNKSNPLDELIYIHLSKKTNEKGYVDAYDRLATAFPNWKGLADAKVSTIRKLIDSAGLGKQRAEEILFNIKLIREKFGEETLDPLRQWSNSKIFDFLTSLKGIGPKSALCIMMYSLGREVFPVDTHVQVVSERLGFLASGLDHDQAQKTLADLFPKKLRYKLHVNMLAHGRKTCKKNHPLCKQCNLNKFCLYYRKNFAKTPKGIPMVDIFCGAGGASLGLSDAGFSVKFAIDNNIKATDTYYLNHVELTFDQVINCNIEQLDSGFLRGKVKEKIFLVFGGPPCQGWSNIGKNRKNGKNSVDFLSDPKNTLYEQFVRQLDIFEPDYFVMENVPGLLSAHNGKYASIIKEEFQKHKYESMTLILNANNFEIAQSRTRIFFIGKRVTENCSRNQATECLSRIQSFIELRGTNKKISFRQEMTGLPQLLAGEGANVMLSNNPDEAPSQKPILIFNDFARQHNARDRRIYALLQEGEDYKDFSKRSNDKLLLPYSTESFRTKFRKIDGSKPSPAIISHLSKDANSYIHPDYNRGITVREGARIQSFPDDFVFLGEGFGQFVLLGNAVPPRLAKIIGSSIIELTRGAIKNGKNET